MEQIVVGMAALVRTSTGLTRRSHLLLLPLLAVSQDTSAVAVAVLPCDGTRHI